MNFALKTAKASPRPPTPALTEILKDCGIAHLYDVLAHEGCYTLEDLKILHEGKLQPSLSLHCIIVLHHCCFFILLLCRGGCARGIRCAATADAQVKYSENCRPFCLKMADEFVLRNGDGQAEIGARSDQGG